jgi:hypothetical protein
MQRSLCLRSFGRGLLGSSRGLLGRSRCLLSRGRCLLGSSGSFRGCLGRRDITNGTVGIIDALKCIQITTSHSGAICW